MQEVRADGKVRLRFQAYPTRVAFSPRGQTIAVGSYLERPIELFDFHVQGPSAELKKRFQALLARLDDDASRV